MVFDHPIIPYGNFRIHIISHPAGKPRNFKERLVTHLLPVTKEGFGGVREPKVREVSRRVTHPDISLLIYVDEVTGRTKTRETTRPVGYFSTQNICGNTVHLLASVISQQDQRLAWYPLCKRIAMALGPAQVRLEGGQPAFFTAQSAYPYIHRDLLADGMMPAHLQEESGALAEHLARVADALGNHAGFEPETSIRHGAFDFDAHEGKSDREIQELVAAEMEKTRDPRLAKEYKDLFDKMGRQDALMAIRRYRGPPDRALRYQLAGLVKDENVHGQVLAELLVGSHRRDIENVNVNFHPKSTATGLLSTSPIITIKFKRNRWRQDRFITNMAQDSGRQRFLGLRQRAGNAGHYVIGPDSIDAPLDASGIRFIHHALSATQTAQRTKGTHA